MFSALLRRLYNTIVGSDSIVYKIYPAVGAADPLTAGIKVTAGAKKWGTYVDIVAVSGITTEFWVCALLLHNAEAIQSYDIDLATGLVGAPVSFFQTLYARVEVTAVGEHGVTTQVTNLPYPKRLAANTEVCCGAGATAAKYIYAAILYATGL